MPSAQQGAPKANPISTIVQQANAQAAATPQPSVTGHTYVITNCTVNGDQVTVTGTVDGNPAVTATLSLVGLSALSDLTSVQLQIAQALFQATPAISQVAPPNPAASVATAIINIGTFSE